MEICVTLFQIYSFVEYLCINTTYIHWLSASIYLACKIATKVFPSLNITIETYRNIKNNNFYNYQSFLNSNSEKVFKDVVNFIIENYNTLEEYYSKIKGISSCIKKILSTIFQRIYLNIIKKLYNNKKERG